MGACELLHIVAFNSATSVCGQRTYLIPEIQKSLHPDLSFKSAADLRFTEQILFIDANIKLQVIAVDGQDIHS